MGNEVANGPAIRPNGATMTLHHRRHRLPRNAAALPPPCPPPTCQPGTWGRGLPSFSPPSWWLPIRVHWRSLAVPPLYPHAFHRPYTRRQQPSTKRQEPPHSRPFVCIPSTWRQQPYHLAPNTFFSPLSAPAPATKNQELSTKNFSHLPHISPPSLANHAPVST
jgi:hypothetical protein